MNRGYIRVSTEEQGQGLSLQAQKQAIKAHLNGARVRFYQDVGSARSLERPGLTRLREDVKPDDTVAVLRLDRLCRVLRQQCNLIKSLNDKGVIFISVREYFKTGIASGNLMLNIHGALAQYESDVISERTADSLKILQANGVSLGQIPYGYYRDESGSLQLDSEEQVVIGKMRTMRKQRLNYNQIARRLSKTGVKPKQGKEWLGSVVNNILRREANL